MIGYDSMDEYTSEIKNLIERAEQGDVTAQHVLGLKYLNGDGITQDFEQAIKWYTRAAERGNSYAQLRLAHCYRDGEGVAQDFEQAVKWYAKSAEQGNHYAQQYLGERYYYGEGTDKDHAKAAKWLTQAVKWNLVKAQFLLGECYYESEEKNYELAFKWYKEAAEQWHAAAQGMLGECYYNGRGVKKDFDEAVKWYTEAAEQGDAPSQYSLAWCYWHGDGVEKNAEKSIEWATESAEQGYADAQAVLGWYYNEQKDYKQAVKWYAKAAEQGHEEANEMLKNINLKGDLIMFLELAKSRRSIRRFEDKDVSREQLMQLIEAAQSAPSAGNCQPWRFYVVKNKKIQAAFKECSYNQEYLLSAPACIVVCTDKKRTEGRYGERGKNLYMIQDTAAAVQNILLCAKDMGLGTVWIGAFDEVKVAHTLNLLADFRPVALIPVGYPAEDFKPQNRRPIDDIVTFIGE